MQNCFLCLKPPTSSSSESPLPDERPCRPLTSLPPSAAASGTLPHFLIHLAMQFSAFFRAAIYTGRCIVWFAVNKAPHLCFVTLRRICLFSRAFSGRLLQRQFVGRNRQGAFTEIFFRLITITPLLFGHLTCLQAVLAGQSCLRTEVWMFLCQKMTSTTDAVM
jgi:hypothetical protein